jgi:hypothetical protein
MSPAQVSDFRQDFAAALADPDRAVPAGLVTADGRVDAKRFAVYRNNVAVSLTAALASRFPGTERLVGADFFRGMARAFVAENRPKSPLLFRYGDDFPAFVAGFPPAATVDYLADVARLEVAWGRSYHAADAAALSPATLAAIDPERLADLRLRPHPAAALIRSTHPVGSIWQAHQSDPVAPVEAWAPETVAVARPEADVSLTVLPPADSAFAEALLAGETLADAAEAGFAASERFDFGHALVGLVSLGLFADLEGA